MSPSAVRAPHRRAPAVLRAAVPALLAFAFSGVLGAGVAAASTTPPPGSASETPSLAFRPVFAVAPGNQVSDPSIDPGPATGLSADIRVAFTSLNCSSGHRAPTDPSAPAALCDAEGTYKYLTGPARLVNGSVAIAEVTEPHANQWAVVMTLTPAATTKFGAWTTEVSAKPAPANQIAVAVDDVVISAPIVATAITDGQVQIAGLDSEDDASALAIALTGTPAADPSSPVGTATPGASPLASTPPVLGQTSAGPAGGALPADPSPTGRGHNLIVGAVVAVGVGFFGFIVAAAYTARRSGRSP